VSPRPWRILAVDDQPQQLQSIERELEDQLRADGEANLDYELICLPTFDLAMDALDRERFDLVILDIRQEAAGHKSADATAGLDLYAKIRERRFVPVIFFTAVPNNVDAALEEPFVAVVSKDHLPELPVVVARMLTGALPKLVRALEAEVTDVTRQFLGEFAADNWSTLQLYDHLDLAHLLTARLAYSLRTDSPHRLAAQLLATDVVAVDISNTPNHDVAHPGRWYIYPPLRPELPLTGAVIYIDSADDEEHAGWWLVISPACDIIQRKVNFLLMARATKLSESVKFSEWRTSQGKRKTTMNMMRGGEPRYQFMPSFMRIPNLVVDFQDVWAAPVGVDVPGPALATKNDIVAVLDSPFAEAVLTRYSHYRGRIGTPDLDADELLTSLESTEGQAELDGSEQGPSPVIG